MGLPLVSLPPSIRCLLARTLVYQARQLAILRVTKPLSAASSRPCIDDSSPAIALAHDVPLTVMRLGWLTFSQRAGHAAHACHRITAPNPVIPVPAC